ncbi:hypothetical protein HRI_004614500 [Hibiscus trionum]|uniref:Uncharacterized protein n=1 Tax=Hibiscus trionum TaxID=183268 RepID=A0A9W7J7B0_HIBTR|nr:hypothetical protein HRI_004614500 [Hibiscus trionum]
MPTYRTTIFYEKGNDGAMRMNLDLLEDTRMRLEMAIEAINQIVTKYYNPRVKNKQFQASDLVLLKPKASKPTTERGKMAPTWKGPYRVQKALGFNAYKLSGMNGKEVPRT